MTRARRKPSSFAVETTALGRRQFTRASVSPTEKGAFEERMNTEQASLSDILKRDEQGRFASKVEPVAAEPPASEPVEAADIPAVDTLNELAPVPPPSPTGVTPGPSPVPEKVETDEVKGLRAELARIRRQNRQADASARPEPVKPPSVFEDEEGFTRHLSATVEDQVFDRILAMSEENARERFADLKEVMGTDGEGEDAVHLNWIEAVKANPQLFHQFKRAADPVRFAYNELKRQAALKEIGDPVSYREKLRKEIEAEIAAKAGIPAASATAQPAAKPEQVLPDTLAGSKSVSAREAPEFNGPKSLTDIFASAPHMNETRRR